MRHRYIGGAVLAAVVALGWPTPAPAQEGGFQPPLNTEPVIPIPTGSAGQPGFYFSAEYVMLTQTRALGRQTIAYRGLIDASGAITGLPGTFIGTGVQALVTDKIGTRTFQPGHQTEIGYRFDTGVRIYANYLQLYDAHYHAGATLVPPLFRTRQDLSDTFLVSPVFNFHPQFAGPQLDTSFDTPANGGFHTYGVWNGAETMDIKFTQRYQQAELGARIPMFATDYSRVYALTGGRFAWFFERFNWKTTDLAADGTSRPQFAADYSNTLSQRMYGGFVGCGHEAYLGNMFSLSLDLTAAAYMSVAKERAKYKLRDQTIQSKWGREYFDVVPSLTAQVNLWWYPIEGVQMRIGYSGLTFFNTRYMEEPVGFNYGNIDPSYGTKWFRLLHGFNVGFGLFF
jgi:hypothetical protein